MDKLVLYFAIPFAVICIVCAFLEKKVTSPYKWFHVYGRFKAYMALDLTMVGLFMIIGGIFFPSEAVKMGDLVRAPVLVILGGLIILIPGLLIYVRTAIKCPPFLRGRCVISMLITALGVSTKICLFFLVFVWKLETPKTVTLGDGRDYMEYAGDLYTPDGVCVGRRSGYSEYEVLKDKNGNPVAM